MSNQDLIERDYQEYCATHQKISKDEYFGMLRRGVERAANAAPGVSEPSK